jgi:hypothetical protein
MRNRFAITTAVALAAAGGLAIVAAPAASAATRETFDCPNANSGTWSSCSPNPLQSITLRGGDPARDDLCVAVRGSDGDRIRFRAFDAANGNQLGGSGNTSDPLVVGDARDCFYHRGTATTIRVSFQALDLDGSTHVLATAYAQ